MTRLLLLSLFLGCATAPTKPAELPKDPLSKVKRLIAEVYSAVESVEPERLTDLMTADAVVIGLGPSDFNVFRDSTIDEVRRQMLPFGLKGESLKISKSKPLVGIAEGAGSAWFADFPQVERRRDGAKIDVWKPRISGHAIAEEGVWRVDALHVSLGFPDAELYAPGADKRLIGPQDPGINRGAETEPVVALVKHMLDDLGVKVESTSDRAEVALIGTDPTDLYLGGQKFKDLVRPKLAEVKKAAFSQKLEGGPRARLSPNGKSGWVVGNVVLKLGTGKKAQVVPTFRALWVFALEQGDWHLVSEHQSLGLMPEQFAPESADAGVK